jgi:multidrug efflux pump subunit AcrA (membrane-fusion protein)
VIAGQPLLVIESPDLVAAVNDLMAAHSEVDKSTIALAVSEKSTERARRLSAQEALAMKDLQAAESDLARAREDNSRASVGGSCPKAVGVAWQKQRRNCPDRDCLLAL